MKKLTTLMLALLAALAALLAVAPAASASPYYTATDVAYVASLNAEGFYYTDGGAAVVELGRMIGSAVRASPTYTTIDMVVAAGLRAGVSEIEVATVTYYAVYYYAPERLALLKAWAQDRASPSYAA